tara:strand:+ start:719 stop:988 length:270 start_codon:yes stop_codon:yes gene_type:complete
MIEKNESKIKVIVQLEQQNNQSRAMEKIFKIINPVLKFDLRDNLNGGTYSLVQAAYLKQRQNDGISLTQDDEIAARRLSRAFPIICAVS